MLVAGARPNFMKVAPVLASLQAAGQKPLLVHTGQHYDARMSGVFFTALGIPEPDFSLGVGSGSHAQQTARIMMAFEPVLLETRPAWVVVVGDVNSTIACALVAAKLTGETGARVAHIEAGLRSRDWRMPEEVNRVLTDRLSARLFTPSRDAEANLRLEGLTEGVVFAGNVMIDTLLAQLPRARALGLPRRHGLARDAYALVTLHRPSNVDDAVALRRILEGIAALAQRIPVVFPIHPRTNANVDRLGLRTLLDGIMVLDPLDYLDMLALTEAAAVVLTDSGGLQEETTVLGVPCVTLREQTERPVTVEQGTNRLARWPLTRDGILADFEDARSRGRVGVGTHVPEGWDGRAGERIARSLLED